MSEEPDSDGYEYYIVHDGLNFSLHQEEKGRRPVNRMRGL